VRPEADVTIVGAGPAGSATAILLAERGWAVRLLDKSACPRPKVCGEYLSPETTRILDRLGVLKDVDAVGAQPLSGMRIVAPDGTRLDGVYPETGPWRPYRRQALALPRERLDSLLLERARSLPVEVAERQRVTGLLLDGDRVVGVRTEAADGRTREALSRLVVGADGRGSIVARRLGLLRPHRLRRMALVRHVEGLAGLEGRGEIYVDPPDYAILNPVAPGVVNLGLVVPLAHAAAYRGRMEAFFEARLAQLRRLRPRLEGMRPAGRLRVLGPLAYRVMTPRHHGVALVGDAAGFLDPFTGEGLFRALRSAELLVEAAHAALRAGPVSAPALAPYWQARRRAFAAKERLARGLQIVIAHRRLANLAAHALARRPALLATLLGVIGDYVPPAALLQPSLYRSR
jgi:flavin-dependent dehydrogenase